MRKEVPGNKFHYFNFVLNRKLQDIYNLLLVFPFLQILAGITLSQFEVYTLGYGFTVLLPKLFPVLRGES